MIVNLRVCEDAIAAGKRFRDQGGLDRESIIRDIREASEIATPIDVQQHAVQLEGTDEVIAFRVR